MSIAVAYETPSLWSQIRQDLRPFPGRAALTWRIALLCALVAACGMMFMTVESAISCYLIIFLMKPDPVVNIGTAFGLIVLAAVLVAMLAFIIQFAIESPLLQILTIAFTSLLFLYIGAASQLGEIGGIIALVIAFILTLVGMAPASEAVTFGLRYAWYMAAMPMALMAAFNLFLGMSTVRLLRQTVLTRLRVTQEALASGAPAAHDGLAEALRADNGAVEQQAGFVKLLALANSAAARQIAADTRASYALMLAVSALPDTLPEPDRAALAQAVQAARSALEAGRAPPAPASFVPESSVPPSREGGCVPQEDGDSAERAALRALCVMAGMPEGAVIAAPRPGFFFKDALTNGIYQRFAVKTTAAAIICYLIYTMLDWQGIHTALVTCYVAALGSTGETVHKLALRITGCLIGAAIGLVTILFVMPHIDGIGGLMVMVFCGVFVGAWVSTGPERTSYGGVQIALAFLLTVLQGYGPTTSLDTAWDRIVGILLGNLVIYLVFTRIWPVPVVTAVRQHLQAAVDGLGRLLAVAPERRNGAVGDAALVVCEAGKAAEALDMIRFEPSGIRTSPETELALRRAQKDIGMLVRDIVFNRRTQPEAQSRIDALARTVAG